MFYGGAVPIYLKSKFAIYLVIFLLLFYSYMWKQFPLNLDHNLISSEVFPNFKANILIFKLAWAEIKNTLITTVIWHSMRWVFEEP